MPRVDRRAGLRLVAPVRGRVAVRREVPVQVHADHRVPLVVVGVDEHAVAQDARVVHDHVERAERRRPRTATRLAAPSKSATSSVLATASPPSAWISSTTCVRRLGRRAGAVGRAAEVVHHDLGALARERQRVRAADAAARARDHDDSSVADTHRLPPSGQGGNVNQAFAWQSTPTLRSEENWGTSVEHVGEPSSRLRAVRDQIDHPIVDADAHQLEVLAVVMDFIRDVGGPEMPDKLIGYMMNQRRAFRETLDERHDRRTTVPVWWPVPTENTRDRATTVLPGYLYERLDEIGLDFTIVYPGQGLQVITLPGMADDDLRRAVGARLQPRTTRRCSAPYADRMTPAAVIPMHTPDEAIEELALRQERARAEGVRVRGRRRAPGAAVRARASRPRAVGALPGLLRHRQPVRLRPGVAGVHRARRRADVPLGSDRPGLPRRRSRVTSTTRSAVSPRAARHWPSRCSSVVSRAGSPTCASGSSRAVSRGARASTAGCSSTGRSATATPSCTSTRSCSTRRCSRRSSTRTRTRR